MGAPDYSFALDFLRLLISESAVEFGTRGFSARYWGLLALHRRENQDLKARQFVGCRNETFILYKCPFFVSRTSKWSSAFSLGMSQTLRATCCRFIPLS